MSYAITETAIRDFLRSDRPGVLCISGPWGVGKTFAWRKIVEDEGRNGRILFKSYSYVSLFGIADFNNLKREIFNKTVASNNPLDAASPSSIASQTENLSNSVKRHIGPIAKLFGEKGQAIADLITEMSFASIFERIVCFDDLERCGRGVEVRDVLGLAHHLSEEKRCKVVILLNDEKLEKDDKADFEEQFEKVVDAFIRYLPTSAESAEIAFDRDRFPGSEMATVFEALGCSNIRIMKKAESIYSIVEDSAANDEERKQFANTVALASFVRYRFNGDVGLDGMRGYNEILATMRGDDASGDNGPLYDTLSKAGYASTDEIDLFLIDAVRNGYLDRKNFEQKLKVSREQRDKSQDGSLFSKAWDSYHDNLHHQPEEIVSALAEAMEAEPGRISPQNANATLEFMDRLGFAEIADRAASAYLTARSLGHKELEQDHFLWREGPVNSRIQAYYDDAKARFKDERVPSVVVEKMAKDSGWNQEDIELLNGLSVAQIIEMVDQLEGDHLSRSLRFLRSFSGSDEKQYQPFGKRLRSAFLRIAKRSPSVEQKLKAERLI